MADGLWFFQGLWLRRVCTSGWSFGPLDPMDSPQSCLGWLGKPPIVMGATHKMEAFYKGTHKMEAFYFRENSIFYEWMEGFYNVFISGKIHLNSIFLNGWELFISGKIPSFLNGWELWKNTHFHFYNVFIRENSIFYEWMRTVGKTPIFNHWVNHL